MTSRWIGAPALTCALALQACAALHGGQGAGLEASLAEAEIGFAAREDAVGLAATCEQLQGLAQGAEPEPRVLGLLARCRYAQAYLHGDAGEAAARLYEAGREAGWRCLELDPSVQGVLASTGGRMGAAVAARIGADPGDCLIWTVANWSRWLVLRDPAAVGIDLLPLGSLADRAVELSPGSAQALGLAGLAKSLAPRALAAGEPEAESFFLAAIARDPGDLSLRADLAEHVYAPRGDRTRLEATLADLLALPAECSARWAPENRRAQERARALLGPDTTTPGRPR